MDERVDSGAWEGRRVLVLGASGFLGRWLSRVACRAGAEVHVGVRNPERTAEILSRHGVRATLHTLDLSLDPWERNLADLLARVSPAAVFNLAGYGVGREERELGTSVRLNAGLPEAIAKSFPIDGHPSWSGLQVVHAGSALEYGDVRGVLPEDAECRPTTVYGRSKLEGTQALARVCRERDVRGVTARLFTVFGEGERAQRLFPSLVRAARGKEKLALTSGTQRRDFVCAEDAAEGLLRLALSPARQGEIVHLATGRLTSVRDFAIATARLLGMSEDRLDFGALPTRPEEMEHGPVSIARLCELCGGSPSADLEAGIARALRGMELEDHVVERSQS